MGLTEQQIIKVLCEIAIHVGLCDSEPTIDNVIKGLHKANCKKCDELASELLALQREKEDYGGIHNLKPAKNWDEDKDQENGNYMNKCIYCKSFFMGHKRRVVCKECSKGEPTKDIPLDMIENWADYEFGIFSEESDEDITKRGAVFGAKAMQSGEIARWAKENE